MSYLPVKISTAKIRTKISQGSDRITLNQLFPLGFGSGWKVVSVGDSATYLYIDEVLIRSAKVAVIVRDSLTLLVIGLFFVFLVIRVYDLK